MKILAVNNSQRQQQKCPRFGYSGKVVYNKAGNIAYRTTTSFFRPDFNWWAFPTFLDKKYKDVSHVNIINHVCSTGEEPYSLAMRFIDTLGVNKANKYFPIIAKDINLENIRKAQSGILYADVNEKVLLEKIMLDNPKDYFKLGDSVTLTNGPVYQIHINPDVKKNISFSTGDVLKDSLVLSEQNTVLLCRNFWPYLELEKRETLLNNISKKFIDNSSLLVLGEFDFQGDKFLYRGAQKIGMTEKQYMKQLLEKYNFIPTELNYVYEKKI